MKTKIITNRSQLGYGYTAYLNDEILKPDYTGTIKQILECIDDDKNIRSFNSGGTYWKHKWFVRNGKKWCKVIKSSMDIEDIILYNDKVEVEFE